MVTDHIPRQNCQAQEAEWHSCKKNGHYSSLCFSKLVSNITTPSEEVDQGNAFLDTVSLQETGRTWMVTLMLDNQEVTFKVDTGADVSMISEIKVK